jgi:uncharacterized metal-binding protein
LRSSNSALTVPLPSPAAASGLQVDPLSLLTKTPLPRVPAKILLAWFTTTSKAKLVMTVPFGIPLLAGAQVLGPGLNLKIPPAVVTSEKWWGRPRWR